VVRNIVHGHTSSRGKLQFFKPNSHVPPPQDKTEAKTSRVRMQMQLQWINHVPRAKYSRANKCWVWVIGMRSTRGSSTRYWKQPLPSWPIGHKILTPRPRLGMIGWWWSDRSPLITQWRPLKSNHFSHLDAGRAPQARRIVRRGGFNWSPNPNPSIWNCPDHDS